MSTLFVTDPLNGLDASIDSSVGLMVAASAEGAAVWACGPEDLALIEGRLLARAQRIELRPRIPLGDHRWLVDNPWFDVLETWRGWADDVTGHAIDASHFLAEEAPDAVARALLDHFHQ